MAVMRIVGHGIDLVETARIARMVEDHGERFLHRCFTESERAYCGQGTRGLESLAGRFAVKEAVFKALGSGWRGGIAWTDAEVVRLPSGEPTLRLHGKCKDLAAMRGIDQWWISISHVKSHAMASAIAVALESHVL